MSDTIKLTLFTTLLLLSGIFYFPEDVVELVMPETVQGCFSQDYNVKYNRTSLLCIGKYSLNTDKYYVIWAVKNHKNPEFEDYIYHVSSLERSTVHYLIRGKSNHYQINPKGVFVEKGFLRQYESVKKRLSTKVPKTWRAKIIRLLEKLKTLNGRNYDS